MAKRELDLEQDMDLHRAVSYIEDLAVSLRSGTVAIEHGDKTITVKPGGRVEMRVKVSQEEDWETCSIKLAWDPRQSPPRACALRISGEPASA